LRLGVIMKKEIIKISNIMEGELPFSHVVKAIVYLRKIKYFSKMSINSNELNGIQQQLAGYGAIVPPLTNNVWMKYMVMSVTKYYVL
jgi:hypothetical protein